MATLQPSNPTPQTIQRQIEELRREIRMLQSRSQPEDNPPMRRREIVFSHPGTPTTATSASYLISDFDATLHRIIVTAGTAGSTNSVFDLKVNGTVVHQFTLESGDTKDSDIGLGIEVEEWDTISIACSTIGTGLSDVAVIVRYGVVDGDDDA